VAISWLRGRNLGFLFYRRKIPVLGTYTQRRLLSRSKELTLSVSVEVYGLADSPVKHMEAGDQSAVTF
jgi:hypothetical protein